jgi:hypothetical protein
MEQPMPFQFCDSMCTHYWQQGYVVFRRILPATLLRDLRPEADKIRALAHELHGPRAQRLQPLVKYAGERFDIRPFRDYAELPALRDAIQRLLGPAAPGCVYSHHSKEMNYLGLLVEPTDRPRLHGWHRDGVRDPAETRRKTPDEIAAIAARRLRPTCDNQVNCAIYADACLWYVPGSHLRVHDLPGEAPAFSPGEKPPPDDSHLSDAEVERAGLEACYGFPGAVQLYLDAGDFAVYRSSAWHTGMYSPTQPRATIHDVVTYETPREGADVTGTAHDEKLEAMT